MWITHRRQAEDYYSRYLCVGAGEREVQDRDGNGKSKNHFRKGLGDKLLEDRLQMVCSYIMCFDIEVLTCVVLN